MTSKKAFFVGLLTGSVVGSVTALLFAPKSGKELRSDIKVGAEKAVDATAKAVDHVTETVCEAGKQFEDRAAKLVNGAKHGVIQFVDGVKQLRTTQEVNVHAVQEQERMNQVECIEEEHPHN